MAKITDPDSLNQGTEIVIDDTTKKIQLLAAGNLSAASPGSTSGVTGQAVYSFLKEEWKTDADLNKLKFPIKMFTKTDGILQNGWQWTDATTRTLLRDFGWEESVGTEDGDQYACVISLGNFDSTSDQGYYSHVTGFDQTSVNYDKTGNLNEAILIDDASGVDYTGYLKSFLRIQAKLYDEYNLLVEQGFSALEPIVYRLPLSNETDLKIDESDANIDTTTPYTNMTIDYLSGTLFNTVSDTTYTVDQVVQEDNGSGSHWFICTVGGTVTGSTGVAKASWGGTATFVAYEGERLIGVEYYAYNRIVDGATGTAQEIYNYSQRQLRQTTDINDNVFLDNYGTINGNLAIPLNNYLGSTFQTNPGVYVDDFDNNDKNSMEFYDITVDGSGLDSDGVPETTTKRTFPFTAAGNLNFSSNLVAETNADTIYTMYYKYTRTNTETDITISGQAGTAATVNSTNIDLTNIDTGQYFTLSGFLTNTENNGVWEATGNGTANAVAAQKINGVNPIDDVVGNSVTLEQNPYDTPGAIIVDDNSDVDITGQVDSAAIGFDFDYDGNTQGNRPNGTGNDALVVVMAQGLDASEWIDAEFTITRATGLSFTVTAGDERNFNNP